MILSQASLTAQLVKNLPAMQEIRVQSLAWEDPRRRKGLTHSSILAWRIPWAKEPGRLYSPRGHKSVRYNLVTKQQIVDLQSFRCTNKVIQCVYFTRLFSTVGYYKILNIVLYAPQWVLVVYLYYI